MPLDFTCPACEKSLVAPFAAAGQEGSCKFCQARIIAPWTSGQPAVLASVPAAPAGTPPAVASAPSVPDPSALSPSAYTPPGFSPSGTSPALPADLMANPSVSKAFISVGRPGIADFWMRTIAFIIDGLIIGGIQILLTMLMLSGNAGAATDIFSASRSQFRDAFQFAMVLFGARVLYGAILEGSVMQATIGKRLLGMRVCTEEGDRISFLHALWRNFMKWFTVGAVGFVPILGMFPYAIFIYAMQNPLTQTVHDMFANTVVAERT